MAGTIRDPQFCLACVLGSLAANAHDIPSALLQGKIGAVSRPTMEVQLQRADPARQILSYDEGAESGSRSLEAASWCFAQVNQELMMLEGYDVAVALRFNVRILEKFHTSCKVEGIACYHDKCVLAV